MIKEQQKVVFLEENMSNLTSAASGEQASVSSSTQQQQYFSLQNESQDQQQPQEPPAKRKRSLPGHPDPDAEVIAMSPKSLLAKNRFLCEICNKGFQRDQNLQLHRRGHNLPWKLKQRSSKEVRKKVYVCPEASCVHHDPSRALGDLTGIKKHFCRKHGEKKWKCDKCSKKYAVQSDWKAHSKICGTREYRCDCGTLFSRRDSYITHRAFCDALAEETTRGIPTNSLLSNPMVAMAGPSSSSHHFINQQPQLVFNPRNNDSLLSFPLKREQPQFDHHQNLINLPPWLANSPIPSSPFDHHHQNQNQNLSASSSSSMLDHQQQQQQMMQQNDSSPRMVMSPPPGAAPYHTQAHPQMSATALLQRAAQIGATMSNSTKNEGQGHVTDTNSNNTTTTTTAGFFGLNLSSRDHHNNQQEQLMINNGLSSFVNKAAATPLPQQTTGNLNTCPSTSSSYFHDMMMNSLSSSSSYEPHDDGFGIGGMLKKEASFGAFHQTLGGRDFRPSNGNGGGTGNDGLTRDFLGLRPLSQNDILTLAGLGNCITTTNPTSHHDHHDHHDHQDHTHDKPWQG